MTEHQPITKNQIDTVQKKASYYLLPLFTYLFLPSIHHINASNHLPPSLSLLSHYTPPLSKLCNSGDHRCREAGKPRRKTKSKKQKAKALPPVVVVETLANGR